MLISTSNPHAQFKIKVGRFRLWIKKLSPAKKIAVFIGLLFLVTVLSYRLFYMQAKPVKFTDISQYSTKKLSQITNNLHLKLRDYENISQQFFTNQDLNRLLTTYIQTRDNYDVSPQNTAFANFLDGYAFTDPYFHDAMFIDETNPKRKVLTMGEALPYSFVRSFRDTGWFRKIIQADGKIIWFSGVRLDDTAQYYFLLGRRVKNLFSDAPLGVLVFVIREKNICVMINDNQYVDEPHWGDNLKSDLTLMTDSKGIIISTPFKKDIGKNIRHYLGGLRTFPATIQGNAISHSYMSKLKKRPVLVVVYPTEKIGGNLYNIIPVTPEVHPTFLNRLYRLLGYLLLILGILLGGWFALIPGREFKVRRYRKLKRSNISELQATPSWFEELNEKEREVLTLLAQGYTNKEIAKQLFVAEQTIKNYVSIIYSKLDVRDRVQASLKAIEAGLIAKHSK